MVPLPPRVSARQASAESVPAVMPPRSRIFFEVRINVSRLIPAKVVDYAAERALARATSWLKPEVRRRQRRRDLYRGGGVSVS